MKYSYTQLSQKDVSLAASLDQQWFGEYGATKEQLIDFISKHPQNTLSLYADNKFEGFATFEILHNQSPADYIGVFPPVSKVLFMQQFTTSSNYAKSGMEMDHELIAQVERQAKQLGCLEVWEALSTTHPYSSGVNTSFDAFGFYRKHGYSHNEDSVVAWSPNPSISIPCYLFRKQV